MIVLSLNKLKLINCWKGIRYNLGLPTRGQRTHTNAKTIRKLQAHVTASLKSQQLAEAKAKYEKQMARLNKKKQAKKQVKKNAKKKK